MRKQYEKGISKYFKEMMLITISLVKLVIDKQHFAQPNDQTWNFELKWFKGVRTWLVEIDSKVNQEPQAFKTKSEYEKQELTSSKA